MSSAEQDQTCAPPCPGSDCGPLVHVDHSVLGTWALDLNLFYHYLALLVLHGPPHFFELHDLIRLIAPPL